MRPGTQAPTACTRPRGSWLDLSAAATMSGSAAMALSGFFEVGVVVTTRMAPRPSATATDVSSTPNSMPRYTAESALNSSRRAGRPPAPALSVKPSSRTMSSPIKSSTMAVTVGFVRPERRASSGREMLSASRMRSSTTERLTCRIEW